MIKSILKDIADKQRSDKSGIGMQMENALYHSKEHIFAANEEGTLLFANEQWRRYHNLEDSEPLADIKLIDVSPVISSNGQWKRLVEKLKNQKRFGIVLSNPMPLYPEFESIDITLYYVSEGNGKKGTIWGFERDNTLNMRHEQEMERENEELREAKEKAENSDHNKSAFLANMSHEIRTPLNAIVGFSRIIAESDNAEDRKNYYDMVASNSERLLQLINEILDLSKMEAGRIEFVLAPVKVHQMCKEVYEAHVFRCPEDVKLIFEPSDENIRISTDKNRIIQVLSNLIGNAFKFTTHGSISFGYRRTGKVIEFHVTDTGAGIAPEKIDTVFDRFVKANNTVQGTGLGLSICKTIVEKLGGDISVVSEPNKQTTFKFTLPNRLDEAEDIPSLFDAPTEKSSAAPVAGTETSAATPTTAPAADDPDQKKTVLVAEDENYNYILVKAILSKKYNLVHAENGLKVVSLFEEVNPDVILMDMRMPQMGGLDATRIIRQLSPTVPIIAFTAFAFDQDKQAAFEAGCNDFLTKPFKQEDLLDIIVKWINRT
ncbi:MAG: response regulator [Prevotellaceae bacterium]|jgi:signal transduction histidine kinase/CheY-like chemotaxis protein|nr:response regulator [Prevotellaceae bacterium]